MAEPGLPARQHRPLRVLERHLGERGQDLRHLVLEPRMQDRVRGVPHPFGPDLAGLGPKQREQLGGAGAHILVGLARGLAYRLPTRPRIGHRLIRTGLVLTPERQSHRFHPTIRLLDQPLFSSVRGSMTVTTPLWRTRWAV